MCALKLKGVFIFAGDLLYTKMYVKAAKSFHESLLFSILRCSMQFFESTPIGRILNRFSKDIEVTETRLPDFLRPLVRNFLNILSIVVVISVTQPYFILFFIPISISYVFIQVWWYENITFISIYVLMMMNWIKIANLCKLCSTVKTYGIG